MAVEHLVKRTIWVAKCPKCEDSVEKTENPPRSRYCCGAWIDYVEQSSISPEYKALQK